GGHLFQNGLGRAADATTRAGIHLRDRAISATFGDYDNDGRLDLYVATAGGGVLLRNAGDSTFTDVTTAAGLGGAPPATTALFVDRDGNERPGASPNARPCRGSRHRRLRQRRVPRPVRRFDRRHRARPLPQPR